jgi:transposase-like protein
VNFDPPRCPNRSCEQHVQPKAAFFRRRGFYHPKCRPEPIQRFRCRSCRRSFSRQTFRYDYRDRKPDTNLALFGMLISGTGLRQAGRMLRLDIRAVQQKQRKMAALCAHLHGNLCQQLPEGRAFLLDEEETYEGASIRPLTMPVLIDKETWFVVATAVGSIRRLAPAGSDRRLRQDHAERDGARPDQSRECVERVLQVLASKVATGTILLHTDQKASYGAVAKSVFGDRLTHVTTAGTLVRHTHNPLFAINTTLAMTRDNCGRLRRQSWLVTKRAEYLQAHLHIFTAYRNYVRRRFNRDEEGDTAAKLLGLLPRNLCDDELLSWRQDWGDRSIHPMSPAGSHTVRDRLSA